MNSTLKEQTICLNELDFLYEHKNKKVILVTK